MTPSTWPETAYRSTRSWLAADPAIISTSCLSAASSSTLTPRMIAGKNRSSEKTRLAVSGRISAIDSVRWVTRLRAAWLGTYPSSSTARVTASRIAGATEVEPLTTRETVALDTPARRATASSVGRSRVTTVLTPRSAPVGDTVAPDHLPVPLRAVLQHALLRAVVDVHDAEALRVPLGPFEIVHERPDEVPPQVHTGRQGIMAGPEMPVEVLDALGVVHLAVRGRRLGVGGAVLGDHQRGARVVLVDPLEQVGQAGRLDQPVHVGDRALRRAESRCPRCPAGRACPGRRASPTRTTAGRS